jgi:hypothetical protein
VRFQKRENPSNKAYQGDYLTISNSSFFDRGGGGVDELLSPDWSHGVFSAKYKRQIQLAQRVLRTGLFDN